MLTLHNITAGWGGSTTIFNPADPVNRAQMSAFIYRFGGIDNLWIATP